MLWFKQLPVADKSTWAKLRDSFQAEFIHGSQLELLQKLDKFNTLQQQAYQSVDDYLFEIQSIATELNKTQAEVFSKFIMGLKPEIKGQILLHNPENLTKAKSLAKTAESLQNSTQPLVHQQPVGVGFNAAEISSKVQELTEKLEQVLAVQTNRGNRETRGPYRREHEQTERNRSRSRDFGTKRCYVCNKRGHIRAQCWYNTTNQRNNQNF